MVTFGQAELLRNTEIRLRSGRPWSGRPPSGRRRSVRHRFLPDAIRLYRQFLTEHPAHPWANRAQAIIAECRFEMDELATARQEANRTIQRYPHSYGAQKARRLLERIRVEGSKKAPETVRFPLFPFTVVSLSAATLRPG
jgi:hypothetical protein